MGGKNSFYTVGCVICFALILITTWFQYNNTFFTTYEESGKRRLSLAERLRKLPLSFFGKKTLPTSQVRLWRTAKFLEKDCSHYIPALFGSVISTIVIALGLFAFDKAMALAALWVIPVSVLIIVLSYKVQDRAQQRNMSVKMACADGIQEYIETLRDLKANNAESSYLKGLSKIRSVEKRGFQNGNNHRRFRNLCRNGVKVRHRNRCTCRCVTACNRENRCFNAFYVFCSLHPVFTTRCRRHFKTCCGGYCNADKCCTNERNLRPRNSAGRRYSHKQRLRHYPSTMWALPTRAAKRCLVMCRSPQNRARLRRLLVRPAAERQQCHGLRSDFGIIKWAKVVSAVWIFQKSIPKS